MFQSENRGAAVSMFTMENRIGSGHGVRGTAPGCLGRSPRVLRAWTAGWCVCVGPQEGVWQNNTRGQSTEWLGSASPVIRAGKRMNSWQVGLCLRHQPVAGGFRGSMFEARRAGQSRRVETGVSSERRLRLEIPNHLPSLTNRVLTQYAAWERDRSAHRRSASEREWASGRMRDRDELWRVISKVIGSW